MGKTLMARYSTAQFGEGNQFTGIGTVSGSGQDITGLETHTQTKIFNAGVLGPMMGRVQGVGAPFIRPIRVNGADSALAILAEIPGNQWFYNLNTINLAANDLIDIRSGGSIWPWTLAYYEADVDHETYYNVYNDAMSLSEAAGTRFMPVSGPGFILNDPPLNNDHTAAEVMVPGLARNGRIFNHFNTLAVGASVLIQLEVNGVLGDPSFLFTPGMALGEKLMTGTRSLVEHDKIRWGITQVGTGGVGGTMIQMSILNTLDERSDYFVCNTGSAGGSAPGIGFAPSGGSHGDSVQTVQIVTGLHNSTSFEVVQVPILFDANIGLIRCEMYNNTMSVDQHLRVFWNPPPYVSPVMGTNVDCVIPAGTDGVFGDYVHGEDIPAGSFVWLGMESGNPGTGSCRSKWWAHTLGQNPAPPIAGARRFLAKLGPVS